MCVRFNFWCDEWPWGVNVTIDNEDIVVVRGKLDKRFNAPIT